MSHEIEITVNSVKHQLVVEPRTLLADVLREDLGLTGTHLSCEIGVCGVCTVVMDGKTVRSCLTLAVQANGLNVETVENLNEDNDLSYLQQAFHQCHALQCGFCTPGFLVVLHQLFSRNPAPSDEEISEVLDDVLCRCTGYQNIFRAACVARTKLSEGI